MLGSLLLSYLNGRALTRRVRELELTTKNVLTGASAPGARSIGFDDRRNLVTDEHILAFAKSTTVTRWGSRDDRVLALTFDDGPDAAFTPQILDILAAKDVKATFFVVGTAGVFGSDLLRRIYRDGHDLGNQF